MGVVFLATKERRPIKERGHAGADEEAWGTAEPGWRVFFPRMLRCANREPDAAEAVFAGCDAGSVDLRGFVAQRLLERRGPSHCRLTNSRTIISSPMTSGRRHVHHA